MKILRCHAIDRDKTFTLLFEALENAVR